MGPLGRKPPTDWRHYESYPLLVSQVTQTVSPIVWGINWYEGFDNPVQASDGRWWLTRDLGRMRGGHAIASPVDGLRDYTDWQVFYDQGSEPECVGFSVSRAATWLNRKRYDARWLYAEAQKHDEWPGECVDMETQALTKRGWMTGDEIQTSDEVLGLDVESGFLRWATVEHIHRYVGAAYRLWRQRGTEIAVTENHRWVVTNRNLPGRYELVTTDALKSQHAAPRSVPSSEQPAEQSVGDRLVELVAWTMTEGHYRPEHRRGNAVVISQKVHAPRVAMIVGRRGHERDGLEVWEIGGETAAAIREVAPDRAPTIEWLRSLTQWQLRLFIEVCVLADGNLTPANGNRRARYTFAQLPGPRLDAFLAACSLAGQAVSRAGVDSVSGVETWTLRSGNYIQTRKLTPSPFVVGNVWCPQSELGTFVARRRGTVWITGNSYDGTSVRAGLDILKNYGHRVWRNGVVGDVNRDEGISTYRWTNRVEDIITLLGHPYGVKAGAIPWNNSWGKSYPRTVWVPGEVAQRLIDEDGEVAVSTDR